MQLFHLHLVILVSYFINYHAQPFNCNGCLPGPGDCCGALVSGTNTNCGTCPASSCPGSGLDTCSLPSTQCSFDTIKCKANPADCTTDKCLLTITSETGKIWRYMFF